MESVNVQQLITEHTNIWTSAIENKSSRGRGGSKKQSLSGIRKLRELILELAVRGKLVPQDPNDEPVYGLLERIAEERDQLVKEKKIKKPKKLPAITDEEYPYSLPEKWGWVRLGTIGNIFNGNSVSSRVKEEKYTGIVGLPFIATKDVKYGFEELDYDNGISIPVGEAKFKVAHKNAVLMCSEGGSAGKKCGITNQDICFGNKLFANELYGEVLPQYILSCYLTPTFRSAFSESMTGIIGGISANKFVELIVPLPPITEQKRISAKVDELMGLCDQLEQQTENSIKAHQVLVETLLGTLTQSQNTDDLAQNWERIAEHFDTLFTTEYGIDQLKQAILQLAVMGKLVPQDSNDELASKLLDRIAVEKERLIKEKKIKKQKPLSPISEDEKIFELPQGWEWAQCENVSNPETIITYGILKPVWVDNGISTVRIKDMIDGRISLTDVVQCSQERASKFSKTTLLENDLLIAKDGATLGKTAFVPPELAGGNITQHVLRFSIDEKVNRKFIRLIIDSPIGQGWMSGETKGVALPGVNVGDFRRMPIAIPPIEEQHRIVIRVNQLTALCDRLKLRLQQSQTIQLNLTSTLVEQVL